MSNSLIDLPTIDPFRPPSWLARHEHEAGVTSRHLRHIIDPDAEGGDCVAAAMRTMYAAFDGPGADPGLIERRIAGMTRDDRRNVALRLSVLRLDELLDHVEDPTEQRQLESAKQAITNLSMVVNAGLAGAAAGKFKDPGGELNDELDGETSTALAAVWLSWDPSRSALSTRAERALHGAGQKVLRSKTNLRSMSERAVARRQEVLSIVERLRRAGKPATVETIHEASKADIDQIVEIVDAVASGRTLDTGALNGVVTFSGDLLRRTVTAMADQPNATHAAVRDKTGISPYRIDQVLNSVTHVSLDAPVDHGDPGGSSLADRIDVPVEHEPGLSEAELLAAERYIASLADQLDERQLWVAIGRFGLLGAPVERLPSLGMELAEGRGAAVILEKAAKAEARSWLTNDQTTVSAMGENPGALTNLLS